MALGRKSADVREKFEAAKVLFCFKVLNKTKLKSFEMNFNSTFWAKLFSQKSKNQS